MISVKNEIEELKIIYKTIETNRDIKQYTIENLFAIDDLIYLLKHNEVSIGSLDEYTLFRHAIKLGKENCIEKLLNILEVPRGDMTLKERFSYYTLLME